jgi:hypothetical protein
MSRVRTDMEVINRAIDIKQISLRKAKEVFDKLSSDGITPCPLCNTSSTKPYPGCWCRSNNSFHINKWHHVCQKVAR